MGASVTAVQLKGCVAGDINDYRIVTVGGVEDLTTISSIEAHVWNSTTDATLAATVIDPVARTVRVEHGDTGGWLPSLPRPGKWWIEVEGTWGDGTVLTFPTPGDPVAKVVGSEAWFYVRAQGS
jgi:hypothetical protein